MSYQLSAVCACAVASSIMDVVVIRLVGGVADALRLVRTRVWCHDLLLAAGKSCDWLKMYEECSDWLKRSPGFCDWLVRFTCTRKAPPVKLRLPACTAVAASPRPALRCR